MGFNFFKLKYDESDLELAKKEIFNFNNSNQLWDPGDFSPNIEQLKQENAINYAKYLYIKKNPNYLKKLSFKFILILSIILFILSIFLGIFAFIFLILFIGFYAIISNLTKDLIKLQIAYQNNWLYMPQRDSLLWRNYVNLFPEVFNKGEKNQSLEDIFWGAKNSNGKLNDFVSGLFHYTTTSTDSKGRRDDTEHTLEFFIIKLPKKLKSRFYLYPENHLNKIRNFFTKKEINTESNKFNKTFAFSYNGSKVDNELEIVKILSPRVQEELLNLNDNIKKDNQYWQGLSVLFTNDAVVFLSSTPFKLIKFKTNFLKSPNIDQRDIEHLTNELNTYIDISSEIIKYLD